MKLTTYLKAAALSLSALALFGTQAQAQLLVNGDFSSNASSYVTRPGYSNQGSNPGITGWTLSPKTATNGVGLNGSGTSLPTVGPQTKTPFGPTNSTTDNQSNSITNFAFLQTDLTGGPNANGSPSISQTVSFDPLATYTLTFDAAERSTSTATAGTFTVSFGGTTYDILFSATQFTLNTFTFEAPTNGNLVFTNIGTNGKDTTLDIANVSLTSVRAVPEPSSYALGLVVLAVLAFEIRRRQALQA